MADEQSSACKHANSLPPRIFSRLPESPVRKRPRRSKQDPQFIFEKPTGDDPALDATTPSPNKRSPNKAKNKAARPVETADASADLYEPGDIVWCKLGGFPWWPALIVGHSATQEDRRY